MGIGTGSCPNCGLKFNARTTSIGTMRRCQGCGHKFVLHEAPTPPATGCLQALTGLVVLAGISVVAIFVCCGGIALFSANSSPEAIKKPISDRSKSQVSAKVPADKHEVEAPTPKPNPTRADTAIEAVPSSSTPSIVEQPSEDLYTRLDKTYGVPIGKIASADVVARLRALGFAGSDPMLHPNGLPDIPEAKVSRAWHLSKSLPAAALEVDIIGDDRGALRLMEIQVTSLDGKPAKLLAKQLLPPITGTLARPLTTRWLIDNAGQNRTDTFDGHKVEAIANSDLTIVLTIAGSPDRSATDYHSPREWNDASGGFRVTASFVSMTNGVVKLRKADGKVIDVPMERLSIIDQEFVNRLKK